EPLPASYRCSRTVVYREIWSWLMLCKAHATSPEIHLTNGLFILRTAKPSEHSTCSGNFIGWHKSSCVIAAQKLTGYWKTGGSFWKQLQITIKRSSAGWTGSQRNGCWKRSSNPKD